MHRHDLALRRVPRGARMLLGIASLLAAAGLLAREVDGAALAAVAAAMADHPTVTLGALAAFGLAFLIRAHVWTRVLPGVSFRHALAGIHLALGANHVLPLRLGEPFRVLSVVRRTGAPLDAATASTVTLRAGDILAVAVIGLVVSPSLVVDLLGLWGLGVLGVVLAVGAAGIVWMVRVRRRTGHHHLRLPGPGVALGSLAAWLLEALLVWQCARFAGLDVGYRDALVVTCIAVAAQTVAIAPSGLGTYEAASAAAYAVLGFDAGVGFAAALGAHALKTGYSLVAGGVAVLFPRPSLLGHLRLPRRGARAPAERPAPADPRAPVVLFLPARDEEEAVAGVVARVPATVHGHPVQCLVIDDGSTDATADRARAAGAEVVAVDGRQGLGAAVRRGLAEAAARGAAATAFCDADGEYAPEELGLVVGPVLDGTADYVVGSRFAGTIHHMRPHRRLGNIALTRMLAFVARHPVTDGQSGYRALSPAATRHAEIIHDFNYAQVLTLDLLGKGFRYEEVPISYSFRTTGRSFVRLGRYLRHVGPAVWREVNRIDPAPGGLSPT